MTPDPRQLLTVALGAADAARDVMLRSPPPGDTGKPGRGEGPDAGVAIERAVRAYLEQAAPGIAFPGQEEGGLADLDAGWRWIMDPVGGAANFARRGRLCATSLALLRDGRPVLGVIDTPFLAARYHAVEGQGAWNGTRGLAVSTTSSLRDAIVAVDDYATGREAGRRNQSWLAATVQLASRVHRIRMLGTAAIDLAWLADGALDASITFASQPAGMAAGLIVAREAGATVTDADGNPCSLSSATAIAAPGQLIDQLVSLVQAASAPASEPSDDQVAGAAPYAELDAILSRARYLVFDFDGLIREPVDAVPAAYLFEALAACRDSSRVTAVVATTSAGTAGSYLARHGLDEQIQHLTTLNDHVRTTAELLDAVTRELGASPPECALITATPAVIEAARHAGLAAIGYAATAEAGRRLAGASSDALLPSLADLTLRLRARPLPS